MAHFTSTTTLLKKGKVYTSLPIQTDFAEYITGSLFSDVAGELEVQQTFDLPNTRGENETVEEWMEKAHWDIVTVIKAVAGKTNEGFVRPGNGEPIFAQAPYYRLVYTNGAADQTAFRLFSRCQEKGRI
jgi:hypothetical protein